MMRAWLVGLAVVACAASGAAAQRRFSSRVETVRVDALVTDDGRPVTGLTAADFEVRDNGVLQRVELVSTDTVPVSVMLALDTSASLTPPRLEALRVACRALLKNLRPGESAGLVTFSHTIRQPQAMSTDVQAVVEALARVEPDGSTALVDAVYSALSLTEDAPGRPLLVVFSDGTDTISLQQPRKVVRAARQFETVLYGVSAGGPPARDPFLRDVARATGGSVFNVGAGDSLERTFARVLDEFRQRYLLSFTPQGVTKGGWHTLDVRVKRRGASVRARPGYVSQ